MKMNKNKQTELITLAKCFLGCGGRQIIFPLFYGRC